MTYHLPVVCMAEGCTAQTEVGCLAQDTPELQLHWDRLGRIQVGYILPVREARRGWRSGNHMDTTRRSARPLQ
jgi:hypothetical protein